MISNPEGNFQRKTFVNRKKKYLFVIVDKRAKAVMSYIGIPFYILQGIKVRRHRYRVVVLQQLILKVFLLVVARCTICHGREV